MTGSGSVRIWAGANGLSNAATAAFRVLSDGSVYSRGTIYVENTNSDRLAGISGEGTSNTSIRIWAGAGYGSMSSAPFRITQDGSLYCEKGEIAGFAIDSSSIRSKSSAYSASSSAQSFWYSQGSTAHFGFRQ
jgi:hypothetical protein